MTTPSFHVDSPESAAAPLTRRVGSGASATEVAEALAATWQQVGAALAPIIGRRGAAALLRRSLHLAGATHACLSKVDDDADGMTDLAALRAVVSAQGRTEALQVGNALLATLQGLLGSLIGPSLTERLLGAVWAAPSSGPPAQDSTP